MIIYATKQTLERYGLGDELRTGSSSSVINNLVITLASRDEGNPLQEWGAKLLYFDRRKCLQVCNFASKFTVFLIDLKKKDIDLIGELLSFYMYELYSEDEEMKSALIRLFGTRPLVCFSKLTDKRIISSLNTTQRIFAGDGENFHQYIEGGVMNTIEINRTVNFEYPVSDTIDGKTNYFYPGDRFRELVLAAAEQ